MFVERDDVLNALEDVLDDDALEYVMDDVFCHDIDDDKSTACVGEPPGGRRLQRSNRCIMAKSRVIVLAIIVM